MGKLETLKKVDPSSFMPIFNWLYEDCHNIIDDDRLVNCNDNYPTGKKEAEACLDYFASIVANVKNLKKYMVSETEAQYIKRTHNDYWLPNDEYYFSYKDKIYVYTEVDNNGKHLFLRANLKNDIDYKPEKMWKNKVINLVNVFN